jgi:hypothetical protein
MKKISSTLVIILASALFPISFCFAGQISSNDGLTLVFNSTDTSTNITITKVIDRAEDLGSLTNDIFSVVQFKPYSQFCLKSNSNVDETGNEFIYSADLYNDKLCETNAELKLTADFKGSGNHIEVDIYIEELNNQVNSRFLSVTFSLPIDMQGWTWGDDIRNSRSVTGSAKLNNYVDTGYGRMNELSRYPIAAIYNDDHGIAIGYPLDHPAAVRLFADPVANQLSMAFDVALSEYSKIPGTAHVKAVIYRFDPEWGFRSAMKKYYEIYPHLFKKRVEKEGLWYFGDLRGITGINDFGIAYHTAVHATNQDSSGRFDREVDPEKLCFDDRNDIYSLRYLTLAGEETYCEYSKDDLISAIQSAQGDESAQAVLNSGSFTYKANFINNEYKYSVNPEYVIYPSDNDVCYDGPDNVYSTILVNSDPDISQPNMATVLWNDDRRAVYSYSVNNGILDGEIIDAVEGQSIKDYLDYRSEHLAASDYPLTYSHSFSYDEVISLPGVPIVSSTYEFLDFLRNGQNGIVNMNKLMMGNYRMKRFISSAVLLDIMGVELTMCGNTEVCPVDMNGHLSLDLGMESLFNLWRTIAYQKPYAFLLYLSTDKNLVTHDVIEQYFKDSLFYGFYPGLMEYAKSVYQYFHDNHLIERDRGLFKKYIPLIQMLGRAGWEPVTYARTDDPDRIYVERFGSGPGNNVYFTIRNVSDENIQYVLSINAEALQLPLDKNKEWIDVISGQTYSAGIKGSYIEIADIIGGKDVRLIALLNNYCPDNDNDGYSSRGGICGEIDCDDNNGAINPGANEIENNWMDDDCDPITRDVMPSRQWLSQMIDNDVAVDVAPHIVADSNGKIHMIYRDMTNGFLKYATNKTGTWQTIVVDESTIVGEHSSIALDSQDHVHVSYYDSINKYLNYATNESGQWVTETVDMRQSEDPIIVDAGEYNSIAIDSVDNVYILYSQVISNNSGNRPPRIVIASRTSGSWTSTVIEWRDTVVNPSISIDDLDEFHIAYNRSVIINDDPGNTRYDLVYMTGDMNCTSPDGVNKYPQANWSSTIIDNIGNINADLSIATEPSGYAHIVYYDEVGGILKHATITSGDWTVDAIDKGSIMNPSITLDTEGSVYVSYYDTEDKHLKLATNAFGSWAVEIIDDGGDEVGSFSSIDVDSSRNVHLSYYDAIDRNVKHSYAFHASVDVDADGYSENEGDCDDSDPDVSPGAVEICDWKDNDCDGSIDEGMDSGRIELKHVEIEWDKGGGSIDKVKIHGDVYLGCMDYTQLSPEGSVNISISSVNNVLSEEVDFLIKGKEGKKWEYKVNDSTLGLSKFKIDWEGAKFLYDKNIKIKSEHLGYDSSTLEIERKTVVAPLSITIGNITIMIDASGAVSVNDPDIEYDLDDDGELEVELPFAISQDTVIQVTEGTISYDINVADYYTSSKGKYEISGYFSSPLLSGDAGPYTFELDLGVGGKGFNKKYSLTDGEWKELRAKEWKYKHN